MPAESKSFSEQSAANTFAKNIIESALEEQGNDSRDEQLKQYPAQERISDFNQEKKQSATNEKVYIGTKVIRATPMSETDFLISVKGKTAEEVRNQETQGAGYKVTYEDGYISWSPRRAFEQCYREVSEKEKNMIH